MIKRISRNVVFSYSITPRHKAKELKRQFNHGESLRIHNKNLVMNAGLFQNSLFVITKECLE